MGPSVTRRNLFRSRRPGGPDIRPPWAIAEERFLDACSRCPDCRQACPTGIIVRGDGGFPILDFGRGACTFCGRCAEACRPRALAAGSGGRALALVAIVDRGCLSAAGTACRVCGEHCEAGAIRFRLQIGGRASPDVDQGQCIGCGACVGPCPTGAITMRRPEEISECA